MKVAALTLALALAFGLTLQAQGIDGHVSLMVDGFPSLGATEGRARVFAKYERDFGSRIHVHASGFWDGLYRHRTDFRRPGDTVDVGFGLWEPLELSLETRWQHADLRVGWSRVPWGRLDEFQPTDVINPLDLTRFFFEGRSEGRMPVGLVRARWLPSDRFALEGIYVPFFRAGRFDQLDESTAPFNPTAGLIVGRETPARTLEHAQGGIRTSVTSGRVDWSLSAYRGFESQPVLGGDGIARYPRFTMIGADFETVKGQWGVRGELAAFVERQFQLNTAASHVEGRSIEAGVGIDRKAGDYRVSSNVILSQRSLPVADADDQDVTIVGSLDRSFVRETRTIRVFAVYNVGDQSVFGRVIATWSMRDNLALEGSLGVFGGEGADLLSVFADRDFLYARVKVFF